MDKPVHCKFDSMYIVAYGYRDRPIFREINCPEKGRECEKCGWNPAVDKMRKERRK